MAIETIADQNVTPRFYLQHTCEVFGGTARRAIRIDRRLASYFTGGGDRGIGFSRRIHGYHEVVTILNQSLRKMGRRNASNDFPHTCLNQILCFR